MAKKDSLIAFNKALVRSLNLKIKDNRVVIHNLCDALKANATQIIHDLDKL